jgi:hypothetical protein
MERGGALTAIQVITPTRDGTLSSDDLHTLRELKRSGRFDRVVFAVAR